MQAFVLDVSACLPWCFEDEVSPLADQALDWATEGSALHVPAIWPLEIGNALHHAVRRQRITQELAGRFLQELGNFLFHIHPPPDLSTLPTLLDLSRRHGLTVYDAAYLDLATRLALPIATQDEALIRACTNADVALVRPAVLPPE